MAELLPAEQPDSTETISILLLASRWQFDTYGLSTVNKSLVNNLRMVDLEGKNIKITCAVVEEDGKIKDVDVKDADNYGVKLRGAKRPNSRKRENKPKLEWLDESTGTYYLHLQDQKFDFIVGHAPYLANGCFNFRDIFKWREVLPKIVLMFHGLPKDAEGEVDDEMLLDWLNEADIVFSVGKAVESELADYIKAIEEDDKPIHKMYIPSYPLELFHIMREEQRKEVVGTQNVTMMSAEFKDLDVTGLDFPLAVNATIGAAEHIRDFDGVRMNLTILAAHEDDREKWKEESKEIFRSKDAQGKGLSFKTEVPTDNAKLQSYLKRSNLLLLPLKPDSPLFGTEALSAIAAGVPVLVSRYSGIARLLQKMAEDESVVYGIKSEPVVNVWKERILERLLRPEESQRSANRLREQFLLDTSIAETHLDFINIISEKAFVQLQTELQYDSESVIPQENIDAAIKFGVETVDATNVNKYIVAFLRKLLTQREKLDNNLLTNSLNPATLKKWRELLSSLEEKNRKMINIQSGSLIFTLFCPTVESRLQLQDENWRIEIQEKMLQLFKFLGAEVMVKLQRQDLTEMLHPLDAPGGHHLVLQQKMDIADSEKRSIGYETMTTVSDLDSELLESELKVEGWLAEQLKSSATDPEGKDQSLQPVETWTLDHVQPDIRYVKAENRFTVSESGNVGISREESPSLSVMYPNTDKSPVVLSDAAVYRSVTFLKVHGKEYLAAACVDDGCLYLWDVQAKTSKKFFDPKLSTEQYKEMIIFKIDNHTIGFGEVYAAPDGSRRVFILKTDTDEAILTSTLRLFTARSIWDMCYSNMEDGMPCLLLCIPRDHRIMAVEMVSGKIRWEVEEQQMGEEFEPWTICTNENTVYVADFIQRKIHLLSTSDGTLIKQFDCRIYDIYNIFGVRFHDQHLYVEHKIPKSKYAISKFRQIEEI